MNRDIIFRAWSTVRKPKMVLLNPYASAFRSTDLIERDDWKVMQYTGLKDKNGVEIYEGDIVRSLSNERIVGQVKWGNALFILYMSEQEGYPMVDAFLKSQGALEVIGNIYENPELQ